MILGNTSISTILRIKIFGAFVTAGCSGVPKGARVQIISAVDLNATDKSRDTCWTKIAATVSSKRQDEI